MFPPSLRIRTSWVKDFSLSINTDQDFSTTLCLGWFLPDLVGGLQDLFLDLFFSNLIFFPNYVIFRVFKYTNVLLGAYQYYFNFHIRLGIQFLNSGIHMFTFWHLDWKKTMEFERQLRVNFMVYLLFLNISGICFYVHHLRCDKLVMFTPLFTFHERNHL